MIDNLTNNRELFNRDNRRDQLTLTLKMTTAQVVNNNSPIQDYTSTRTIIHNLLLNWLLVGSNRSQHYNNDHKLISVASFVTFPLIWITMTQYIVNPRSYLEFLSLIRRRYSARDVPIGEERGETDVFAGYTFTILLRMRSLDLMPEQEYGIFRWKSLVLR